MARYWWVSVWDVDYNRRYIRRYADTANARLDALRFIFRVNESGRSVCYLRYGPVM